MTPTQRSLVYLREQGYLCGIVERYNSFTKTRHDLFGWADLIAIRENEVLLVQVTSTGVSSRIKKIMESETLPIVRKAGVRIEVHGWRKNVKGRYVMRIEDLS